MPQKLVYHEVLCKMVSKMLSKDQKTQSKFLETYDKDTDSLPSVLLLGLKLGLSTLIVKQMNGSWSGNTRLSHQSVEAAFIFSCKTSYSASRQE